MTKIEKKMCFVNKGYSASRELFAPDCEVSQMIFDSRRGTDKRQNFVFEDLVTFNRYGWKIHYRGKKSTSLNLIDAIFEE